MKRVATTKFSRIQVKVMMLVSSGETRQNRNNDIDNDTYKDKIWKYIVNRLEKPDVNYNIKKNL